MHSHGRAGPHGEEVTGAAMPAMPLPLSARAEQRGSHLPAPPPSHTPTPSNHLPSAWARRRS